VRGRGNALAPFRPPGGDPVMCTYCGNPKAWPSCDWVTGVGITFVVAGWLWLATAVFAGQPNYPNQMVQQQYIGDVVQTMTEQAIPKGDMIKQLVLELLDDIGYVKALLWLAMLPLAGILALVFGVFKVFKR